MSALIGLSGVAIGIAIGTGLGVQRERAYGVAIVEGEMDERYDEGYEAGFQEGRRNERTAHHSRAEYVLVLYPRSTLVRKVLRAICGTTLVPPATPEAP